MVPQVALTLHDDPLGKSVFSFQDDKQAVGCIGKNLPLFGFDPQFPNLGKRPNFAVRMTGVENDVVSVCRHSMLIIVDRSEISAVVIRSFEMSKPSMSVIRGSDS